MKMVVGGAAVAALPMPHIKAGVIDKPHEITTEPGDDITCWCRQPRYLGFEVAIYSYGIELDRLPVSFVEDNGVWKSEDVTFQIRTPIRVEYWIVYRDGELIRQVFFPPDSIVLDEGEKLIFASFITLRPE